MVLIDANIIIRYLVAEPREQYEQTVIFFDKVYAGEIVCEIDEIILAEVIYVLTKVYKIGRVAIVEHLNSLFGYAGVRIVRLELAREALSLFAASSIDFADAFLCARAKLEKMEVFSFDNDVKKCIAKAIGK